MSGVEYAVLGVTGTALIVLIAALLASRRLRARSDVRLVPISQSHPEQYRARTPAGSAMVTKVLHDQRGWAFEVVTYFRRRRGLDRGPMPRVHYTTESPRDVERVLRRLAEAHLAGKPQTGHDPQHSEEPAT